MTDEIETAFREDLSYRIGLWVERGLSLGTLLDALEREITAAQSGRRKDPTGIMAMHDKFVETLRGGGERVKRRPTVTFFCPACKQVSVADHDDDGNCICPHCAQR